MSKGIVIYNKAGGYSGYLGNRMFQTAATIGIAKANGMDYVFPPSDYFNYFKGPIPVGKNLHFTITEEYREPKYHYTQVILNPEKNYNLITPDFGFQTAKYWDGHENTIKSIFTFNDEITSYVYEKYNYLLYNQDIYLCSIHVRRGDYVNLPNHHPVQPIEYYLNAAREVLRTFCQKEIVFVVFSNDMKWCRENFSMYDIFDDKIVFAEGNNEAHDMHFMSLCPINIMANSSFSWWAQYLNKHKNKIAYAPNKNRWYGMAYSHWMLEDMYNPNWNLL